MTEHASSGPQPGSQSSLLAAKAQIVGKKGEQRQALSWLASWNFFFLDPQDHDTYEVLLPEFTIPKSQLLSSCGLQWVLCTLIYGPSSLLVLQWIAQFFGLLESIWSTFGSILQMGKQKSREVKWLNQGYRSVLSRTEWKQNPDILTANPVFFPFSHDTFKKQHAGREREGAHFTWIISSRANCKRHWVKKVRWAL